MKNYYVYMLASNRNGTLYIGVTNNLLRRIDEHQRIATDGFTKKYDVKKLVYFEQTSNVDSALWREKNLKSWKRSWKLDLIEKDNPEWKDISADL